MAVYFCPVCKKRLTKKEYERALGILGAREKHFEHEKSELKDKLREAKAREKMAKEEGIKFERRRTDDCVTFIAYLKQKTKKTMLEEWCEDGVKKFERELVQKDLDAMNSPEDSELMKERIRRNLALRRLCRKMGWDIKKLF